MKEDQPFRFVNNGHPFDYFDKTDVPWPKPKLEPPTLQYPTLKEIQDMKMREFNKLFTETPKELARTLLERWAESLVTGDRLGVTGTRIVLSSAPPKKFALGAATVLLGYRCYYIQVATGERGVVSSSTCCAFSPILGCFVGDVLPYVVGKAIHDAEYRLRTFGSSYDLSNTVSSFRYNCILRSVLGCECSGSPEPLSDADTRRLVMADYIAQDPVGSYGLARLMAQPRDSYLVSEENPIEYQDIPFYMGCMLGMKHQAVRQMDRTLAMVSCIRRLKPRRYAMMLEDFDKLGPPDNLLGDALKHIDKFRTD